MQAILVMRIKSVEAEQCSNISCICKYTLILENFKEYILVLWLDFFNHLKLNVLSWKSTRKKKKNPEKTNAQQNSENSFSE